MIKFQLSWNDFIACKIDVNMSLLVTLSLLSLLSSSSPPTSSPFSYSFFWGGGFSYLSADFVYI
jgi:hypothetical protein